MTGGSFRTKPEHRYLESWLGSATLERYDSGCEGEVSVGYVDGVPVKVKVFRRYSELIRHTIGSFVLDSILIERAWSQYVHMPEIWGIDLDRQAVISPFVHRIWPNLSDDDAWTNRAKAVTALVCAAGQFAALDSAEICMRAHSAEQLGLSDIGNVWLGGVDLNGDNLIYDGQVWWAVDF